jgi:CubicO group peptidase (beta-lactamase class C family)
MTEGAVRDLLDEGISTRAFTCAAIALSRAEPSGPRRRTWFAGEADPEHQVPVGEGTAFDLASLTKPICTATVLLRLCEQGRLSLADPVGEWLPECPHLRGVSVFHLATHTSGLPAWRPLYRAERPLEAAFAIPLERLPGLGYCYSDIGYILLAVIVERAGGAGLDRLALRLVFEPLGMSRTGFRCSGPPAVTANCPWRPDTVLRGQVHDANALALGGTTGHAGLFAPLADVACFFEALLPGASVPLVSRGAHEALVRNQIVNIGFQSVGFFTHGNPMLPDGGLLGLAAVGHSGFTGVAGLVNPDRGPAIVLLTNRVSCDPEGDRYRRIRRRLISALAGYRE